MKPVRCDGCGAMTENPQSTGHVIPMDYCEKCFPKVEKYMKDLDTLHDTIAKAFKDGKEKLQNESSIEVFPDETLSSNK